MSRDVGDFVVQSYLLTMVSGECLGIYWVSSGKKNLVSLASFLQSKKLLISFGADFSYEFWKLC